MESQENREGWLGSKLLAQGSRGLYRTITLRGPGGHWLFVFVSRSGVLLDPGLARCWERGGSIRYDSPGPFGFSLGVVGVVAFTCVSPLDSSEVISTLLAFLGFGLTDDALNPGKCPATVAYWINVTSKEIHYLCRAWIHHRDVARLLLKHEVQSLV